MFWLVEQLAGVAIVVLVLGLTLRIVAYIGELFRASDERALNNYTPDAWPQPPPPQPQTKAPSPFQAYLIGALILFLVALGVWAHGMR